MVSDKIFNWLAGLLACSLLLASGCAPIAEEAAKPKVELEKQIPEAPAEEAVPILAEEPAEPEVEPEEQIPEVPAEEAVPALAEEPAKPEVEPEKLIPEAAPAEAATLALKFIAEDSTAYRVVTEAERSIKWEGPLPDDPAFKGGRNRNRLEMTFTQQIQCVDDKGNAIAKIIVQGLKYYSMTKDKVVLDFDSSKIKNPNHPLALLIGQSYIIEIAPTGEVTEVIDATDARTAVRRGSSVPRRAIALLRPDTIKERHRIPALPDADKNQLSKGDNWSRIKSFSFGQMGAKSYEKIYTLKEIEEQDNRQIALVEMNAIPSSEKAEQLHKQQETADFSDEFDRTGTYTGQLRFDLTTGKVEKYIEKLQSEWIVALPSAGQGYDKEPAVLTMSDTRLYSLEKID
jgi:hypothetical protein